jgi:glycolate oxidase FAD binding subunit
LVGSKGQLAMVTQISFKVMPDTYIGKLNAAVKLEDKSVLRTEIENKLLFPHFVFLLIFCSILI